MPRPDLDLLQAQAHRANALCHAAIDLDFATPKPKQLIVAFRQATEMSSIGLSELTLDALSRERPLRFTNDQERERFRAKLKLLQSAPAEDRQAEAKAIADAAYHGKETFRGSKCVAGLLIAHFEDDRVRKQLAEATDLLSTDDFDRLASRLVNGFRINYVNLIAQEKKAAYLADSSIETLRAAQVVLFWRYLMKKASEHASVQVPDDPTGVLESHIQSTPLGLAILLNSRAHSPVDLVQEALSLRSRRFSTVDVATTKPERYLHRLSDEEFGDFQEYLYAGNLKAALRRERGSALRMCVWKEVRMPVASANFTLAFLAALNQSPLAAALSSIGGYLLTGILEDGLSKRWSKEAVIADSYRRMREYIAEATDSPDVYPDYQDRLTRIFGRSVA